MQMQPARPYSQRAEKGPSSAGGSCRSSFHDPRKIVGVLGALVAVAPAIDQLLDAEQHDQRAGDRHAGGVGREWDQRRRPEAAEIVHEVLDAEHQHRQRHRQNDKPVDRLQKRALWTAQALGYLNQIKMVDTACRSSHADEDAPGKEARGGKLQPEDRNTCRARHDIEEHRKGESCDGNSAQYHQDMLERIQHPPFQMAVARDHERQVGQELPQTSGGMRWAAAISRRRPGRKLRLDHLTLRTSSRIFTACGPSSLASWSWIGLAAVMKPDLSTFSTTLTPMVLSFVAESASSLSPSAGSFLATSSAAACTHCCSCGLRLFQVLSLTQMQLLLASCSVIESTGATS